jgi:hypothetical protein
MHEAKIIFRVVVEARCDAAEVLEPCVQALDLPAAAVAAQNSTVLRWRSHAIRLVRRDHLDALCGKFPVKRVGVIGAVADQPSWSLTGETRRKSVSDKGDFVRRSTRRVGGERKTIKVCHHHEFRAFAPLSRTNSPPPFFATMNVPSMKHSERLSSPRVRRSSASASRTRRREPSLTHCWNRRWQVWYGGKRAGRSFHLAPERSIQRMPLITSRFSLHGLPRPSSRLGSSGRCGSMTAHCSSVNSSPRAMPKC